MIRVLVVDDEAPARDKLRRWLAEQADIELLGEAADGLAAAAAIEKLTPDVVFLDIQMPGLSGLEVAAQLEPERAPLLVFVTAFDEHAIKAFELNAVDYLLKPYDRDRLRRTLERLRERQGAARAGAASAVRTARAQTGSSERLLVPQGEELQLIEASAIHWLEADDNYVHVHTAMPQLHAAPDAGGSARAAGRTALRAHPQSTAVNLAEVATLSPLFKGDHEVRLRSGATLRLSRRFKDELFARMPRLDLRSPRPAPARHSPVATRRPIAKTWRSSRTCPNRPHATNSSTGCECSPSSCCCSSTPACCSSAGAGTSPMPRPSRACELPMDLAHRLRMPLLFVIAGAGMWFALRRRSGGELIRERTLRLLVPVIFGMFAHRAAAGVHRTHRARRAGRAATSPSSTQRVFQFVPYPAGDFSWHHLWFIVYLFAYVLLLTPLLLWWRKRGRRRAPARGCTRWRCRSASTKRCSSRCSPNRTTWSATGTSSSTTCCSRVYGFLLASMPGAWDWLAEKRRASLGARVSRSLGGVALLEAGIVRARHARGRHDREPAHLVLAAGVHRLRPRVT